MIYIIGAGISGLSVANNLKKEFTIFEKSDHPGGLATQYKSGNYWFDFSGHYFHFAAMEEIKKYVETFSGFKEYKRDSKIYLSGKLIPFPIQYHLSYFSKKTGQLIFEEMKKRVKKDYNNLQDSLIGNFGETLYNIFFRPFMTKYYGRELSDIIPAMEKGSIPIPDLKSVEEGLNGKNFTDKGYNPVFYYPDDNLRTFIENIERGVSGKIKYKETVLNIDLEKKKIRTDKEEYKFSEIVNTMPLKNLLSILTPRPEWAGDINKLESTSTLVVNLILKKQRKDFHWVYLPEEFSRFYRAGYYPGHPDIACYLEMSLNSEKEYNPVTVKTDTVNILKKLEMIISEDEIVHMDICVIPDSYVIFNKDWKKIVPGILDQLSGNRIYSIGRYGSWNYSSMSSDIKSSLNTARLLNEIS